MKHHRHRALLAALVIVLASGSWAPAALSALPGPPCGVQIVPEYPRVGDAPNVKLWTESDLGSGWAPPSCTKWPRGATSIVVGLAGHFKYAGSADALLARVGSISSLIQVRYWSVTDKQWNNMFTHAVALDRPDPTKLRSDFSAAELRAGGKEYYLAADIRSGNDAISSLHVTSADNSQFVVETENISPLRWAFLTYADPGGLKTWYFFDRQADATWHFYSLTRVVYASSLFGSLIPDNSYINRAVAMYRHFLDLPPDRDPPAAP